MSSIKRFDTITLESDLLKVGNFTDSKGEKVSLTRELLKEIYERINASAPGKTVHSNGEKFGEIKKLVLDGDVIRQTTLVTNPELFNKQCNNGFKYISPEIAFERNDNEQIIGATLDGYALSINPAMIATPYTISTHHFDAATPETPTSTESNGWTKPLSVMSDKIDALSNSISKIGESMTPKPTTEQPSANITLSQEDLAKLINDAVTKATAEALKSQTPPVDVTETKPVESKVESSKPTSEVSEATTENEGANNIPKELMDKLNKITADHDKLLKKQRDERFAELKKLGVTDPKTLLPDSEISLETQIAILDKYKENFAIRSGITAPLSDTLAESSGANASSKLHIDNIIRAMGYEPNDELRSAMASTGLYDDNMNYKN